MSAKHTPGPWHRFAVYDHTEILNQAGHLVAVVGSTATKADRSPNARLIAAAPDLLEALQLIVQWDACGLAQTDDLMVKARAAIEKAAGKQP